MKVQLRKNGIIDNFQASSLDSSQFYDREVKKKILATIEEELIALYLQADQPSKQLNLLNKLGFGAKSEKIMSKQLTSI